MKKFENFIKSQIVPTLPQVLPSWGKQSEQESVKMVNENSIREHFEESARNKGLVVRRVFGDEAEAEGLQAGDYLFHETRVAWDWFQSAWQASRATWRGCSGNVDTPLEGRAAGLGAFGQ